MATKEVGEEDKNVEYPDSFTLDTEFKPKGDQPEAIKQLIDGFKHNARKQTLLGTTGSGKTLPVPMSFNP